MSELEDIDWDKFCDELNPSPFPYPKDMSADEARARLDAARGRSQIHAAMDKESDLMKAINKMYIDELKSGVGSFKLPDLKGKFPDDMGDTIKNDD